MVFPCVLVVQGKLFGGEMRKNQSGNRVGWSILVGIAALLFGSSVLAQNTLVLKVLATEANAKATAVDASLGKLEKDIRSLEISTDKIKSKSDTAAIKEASTKLVALTAEVNKLDADTSAIIDIARKMQREIGKLQ